RSCRQGLFDGETTLVEGAADDGPGAPGRPCRRQVSERGHAAGSLDLQVGSAANDLAQQVEIGSGQGAVAADVGDQQVAGGSGRIAIERGPQIDGGGFCPALERGDPAVAVVLDVEGEGQAVGPEALKPGGD